MSHKLFELIDHNLPSLHTHSRVFSSLSKKLLPVITISREMGSGGRPIAETVAKKLGKKWKVYNQDMVDRIAKETSLGKALIRDLDETQVSLIDELIAYIFGKRYYNLNSYYKGLVHTLSAIGQRGYAVIIGRGANFLLPNALNVRIICNMEQRILWEMQYKKLTRYQAIRRIELSDKKRADLIKAVFSHDIRNAYHYDLVIRTGPETSIKDAANIVVHAAKKKFRI